jgi:hypothetical protein
MLDGKQRNLALLNASRGEHGTDTVSSNPRVAGHPRERTITRPKRTRASSDGGPLAPFRKQDADEALQLIKANGFDKLHLAFLQKRRHRKRRRMGRLAN